MCVCVCVISEKPQVTPRRGFSGKGKNITTKHDEDTCGRKNTARMDKVGQRLHVLTHSQPEAKLHFCFGTFRTNQLLEIQDRKLDLRWISRGAVPPAVAVVTVMSCLHSLPQRCTWATGWGWT